MLSKRLFVLVVATLISNKSIGEICEEMTQCDSCTTNGQFQQAALNAAPPIPSGEDLLSCRVFVTNRSTKEARVYNVNKGHEPGFTYEWATATDLTPTESSTP